MTRIIRGFLFRAVSCEFVVKSFWCPNLIWFDLGRVRAELQKDNLPASPAFDQTLAEAKLDWLKRPIQGRRADFHSTGHLSLAAGNCDLLICDGADAGDALGQGGSQVGARARFRGRLAVRRVHRKFVGPDAVEGRSVILQHRLAFIEGQLPQLLLDFILFRDGRRGPPAL